MTPSSPLNEKPSQPGGPLSTPIAPLSVTTGPARVRSSAPHSWDDTLAFDIGGTAAGKCRHQHEHVSLQMWWQPLAMRPLPGGSWRCAEPAAQVWLPGEEQHFEWRRVSRVNIVFIRSERVERILERPYAKSNLSAWRGVEFNSPFVARVLAAMSEDIANGCPAGPLVGESLTAALVAHLAAGPSGVSRTDARPALSPRCLERAVDYVEANLARPLRMAELASAAGCSPRQLSRAFRERLGKLPHDYVIERRVQRASSLIAVGASSLAQVASAVGFADQSQMTKMFRKVLGTTPGRWRKCPGDSAL